MGNMDEIYRLVLEEGCSINAGDYDKRTALHLAASEGNLDMVRTMIEDIKVNVSPGDRFSGKPLDDAIRHKHSEIETLLKACGAEGGATATDASITVASEGQKELRRVVPPSHMLNRAH